MSTTLRPPDEILAERLDHMRTRSSEVRRARVLLMERLHSMTLDEGLAWVAEALEDPPDLLAGMTVFDLLSKVRMLRPKMIDRMMDRAGVGPVLRLKDLALIDRVRLAVVLQDRAVLVARERGYKDAA